MDTWLSFIILLFFFSIPVLFRRIHLAHETAEPPILSPRFPIFGHLLGMLQHGSYYYTIARQERRVMNCDEDSQPSSKQIKAPIFTMRVPGAKIYIVKSPQLASQVDRNPKDISFSPYALIFAERILLSSKTGLQILNENLHEDGSWGCLSETRKVMHDTMSPGEDLQDLMRNVARHMWPYLASKDASQNIRMVNLHQWLSHVICMSTSNAVWGPKNPFKDPAVERGFWAVKKHFAYLGLNFLPSITSREGSRGREDLFKGFRKYYTEKGQRDASSLVKARYLVNRKYNISMDDIAKYELSVCLGVLINSTVAAFWCLFDIYSRPELLKELRKGLLEAAHSDVCDNNIHVDIQETSRLFPKLEATVREILRLKAFNVSGRIILKDVTLGGKYVLKKDSLLLVPSAELHNNTDIWGPSAKDFDPSRFMKSNSIGTGSVPASSHRTFGGGSSLCPGRHVFMKEIMIMLTIMLLKYDVKPVEGFWKPIKGQAHISASILAPVEDVRVIISERENDGKDPWAFSYDGVYLGAF